jgi:hypothetical protein
MCVMTTLLGPRNLSESEVSVDGSIASENRMTTLRGLLFWRGARPMGRGAWIEKVRAGRGTAIDVTARPSAVPAIGISVAVCPE